MSNFDRSSNIREERAQRAFVSLIPGGLGLIFAIVLFNYASDWTVGLRWVVLLFSVAAICYGVYQILEMRKVTSFEVVCPFCQGKNVFTEQPMSDVRCDHCNREVPIVNGRLLRVFQVRCGYCNALNWYSEKSTGLICEECDREIPIANEGDGKSSPAIHTYSRHDDDTPHNLILLDPGQKREEMIPVLQKMLALNRNQVKDIMDDVPVILLQGVPKKKAELMAAQIQAHGGRADSSPTP
jgi:large subunit ribosomal protein L7/L12